MYRCEENFTSLALGTLTMEYSPVPRLSSRTLQQQKLLKFVHVLGKHYLRLLLTELVCVSKVVGSWVVHQGVQGAYLTGE